ncbi:MAG: YihY/virulence factor BrkB family protein [Lachnospiraceae bacterium]|nr:YihY/virulence factor BrkB family protein [Lachnospiraceae bacterium]
MRKKIWAIITDFMNNIAKKNIGAYAASTAFFSFISTIPALVLVCYILPYTPLTQVDLLVAIQEIMPDTVLPMISQIVSEVYKEQTLAISVSTILLIWTAGKGMMALIQGLNVVNDEEEKRNYFVVRLVASLYTLGMIVAILVSLFLMVFGETIFEELKAYLILLPYVSIAIEILINFRSLVVIGILTIVFTFIYWLVPNKKMRYKKQLPGALFAAVLWYVFSYVFSLYVDIFHGFSVYGSLTFVVVIMLWFYFCMYIILIGAQINQYFSPAYRYIFGFVKRKQRKKEKKNT